MSVKISIVGTGYVGLVTGACFAELGHNVICIDKDEGKIERIKVGDLPIFEPGLDQLIERNVEAGRISFSTDLAASCKDRDAIFIAVGTPSNSEDGRADLKYVFAAAKEIAESIDGYTVVITKSTVPVGTNRKVGEILEGNISTGASYSVASNPEFLREGAAIADFMEPDRIVVGCDEEAGQEIVANIYAPLTVLGHNYMATDIESAEVIKYASNAFLAVKVSFINEIADLCEAVGANVSKVAEGMGTDKRIGGAFLRPGPGWGGSCFPKDTRALFNTALDYGVDTLVVKGAIDANTNRKSAMVARIEKACDGKLNGKKIAVLGLTFKGQTDDMRESPTLDILPALVENGADVVAFDPSNPEEAPKLLPQVKTVGTPVEAAENADVLVIATDWGVFSSYKLSELAEAMKTPVMVDLRNMFSREQALNAGFDEFLGLGNI